MLHLLYILVTNYFIEFWLKHFTTNVPLLQPLKTSENWNIFNTFRSYKSVELFQNGLMILSHQFSLYLPLRIIFPLLHYWRKIKRNESQYKTKYFQSIAVAETKYLSTDNFNSEKWTYLVQFILGTRWIKKIFTMRLFQLIFDLF